MDAALPPSTVVIATKDRPRLVREAVDAILAGGSRPEEILVVDQSAEPVAVGGARTVSALAAGLSASRNQGILEAAHEIVLLIDDDILVTPGWHRAFVEALAAAGPRGVATGRVVIGEPEVPGGFSPASAVSEEPATYRGRIGTDVLAGGNMAARRQALLDVGLFDERLGPGTPHPSAEDNDLGFRLLEAGYEIVYVPEALAIHRAWRPDRQHLVYRWRYGLGKGGFYTKHASREDRHMLARMRKDVGPRLGRLPRGIRPGRRRAAAGDLVYVAGILAGTASWIWKERVRRRGGS